MFTSILEAIVAFFKAIPIFDRWFTKTATEKIEEKKKELREDLDKMKETGRPQS